MKKNVAKVLLLGFLLQIAAPTAKAEMCVKKAATVGGLGVIGVAGLSKGLIAMGPATGGASVVVGGIIGTLGILGAFAAAEDMKCAHEGDASVDTSKAAKNEAHAKEDSHVANNEHSHSGE